MTDEMLTTAINDSYEGMLHAQAMMDSAQSETLKGIAESLYRAHWANYYILLEIRKQRKRERMEKLKCEVQKGTKFQDFYTEVLEEALTAQTCGQIARATETEG